MTTSHENAELINKDRAMQAAMMIARLDKMGVAVKMATARGPDRYTLIYGTIRAAGPTMDMAVMEFVEHWIGLFGSQVLPKGGK